MKRFNYNSIVLFIFILLAGSCQKSSNDDSRICGTRCSSSTPWVVESLNLGNPCFANRDSCIKWAETHGYSGKPCVDCKW